MTVADEFREAFYRMSYARLDALGIRLDMSKLSSTRHKQEAFRAYRPSNRLRRLVLRFRPKERLRRWEKYNYWCNKQQQEFLNEVLNQGVEMIKRIDDETSNGMASDATGRE